MRNKCACLALWVISMTLEASRLFAQTPASLEAAESRDSRSLSAEFSSSYARSTASPDTSDFHESLEEGLVVAWKPATATVLTLSTSAERELGLEEEKFRFNRSKLSLRLPPIELVHDNVLRFNLGSTLPTNQDDRRYLSYRGSLNAGMTYTKGFLASDHHFLRNLSLTGSIDANRNFFAFDANREGGLNKTWSTTYGVAAKFQAFKSLLLSAAASNTRVWNSDGGRGLDQYNTSLGATYSFSAPLQLSLEEITSDRTLGYDRVTSNLALYDARLTSIVGTLSYSI